MDQQNSKRRYVQSAVQEGQRNYIDKQIGTLNQTFNNYSTPTNAGNHDEYHNEASGSQLQTSKNDDDVAEKLRNLCRKIKLPIPIYIEGRRDYPMREYFVTLQLDSSGKEIALENIFLDDSKRILVESQPGHGKTTFCLKLAYDWAHKATYMNKFKFVYVIFLRQLADFTLEQNLDELNSSRSFIERNAKETLLILDGLDEMADKERESVNKILVRQEFVECTVLATCRTAIFDIGKEEREKINLGIPTESSFYDIKINIIGISSENIETFLQKFVANYDIDEILDHINLFDEDIQEMLKSPLLLLLFAYIIEKGEIDLEMIRSGTITWLYKELLNNLIRCHCNRKGIKIVKTSTCLRLNHLKLSCITKSCCEIWQICTQTPPI